MSRLYTVSNPYRSKTEATYGVTTNFYDALGRPCLVVPPDGTLPSGNGCPSSQPNNTVFTAYSGNTTTVTDQAGKSTKSITDGLGRLTQVFEDPSGLNFETDYSYDALDNLNCVAQKGSNTGTFTNCASMPATWRPRFFTYDSLSRLTQAVNPESGTITYGYDPNGNLQTKISPAPNQIGTAPVTATYSYDPLDRLTQKSFNDGSTPAVKYGYDAVALTGCATAPPSLTDPNPIGARTSMCDGAGAASWSHDQMGRILGDQRTTNGITYGFPQTYNLDGSISTLNYGNYNGSDTVTFKPGGAGRPLSETGSVNNWTIVSAAHYAPNGALCGLSYYGWGAAQNISFNNRFQPLHWHVTETPWGGNPAPPPCQPPNWTASWLDYTYNYVDANGHNNGNVTSIWNQANNYWTQNFTYDSLNRIATAQTNGTAANGTWNCWAETYTIDAWGNLLSNAPNPTTQSAYTGCLQEAPANLTGVVQPSNRLSGMGYSTDAAGNLTADGVHTFTYDAENHLLSTAQTGQTTVSYQYDGDGKRVLKSSGTLYWYGQSNEPLFETSLAGGGLYAYYYFNGRITNRLEFAHWFTPDLYVHDALGNATLVAGSWGGGVWDNSDYYPFGGEWVHQSKVGNHYKFTGKERDPESGDDNFLARYYTSNLGRFMSPDWSEEPVPYADQSNPQSLNLYAYVRGNPVNATDPDGHNCWSDPNGGIHCIVDEKLPSDSEPQTGTITTGSTASHAHDILRAFYDWLRTPRNTGCLASGTVAGAIVGLRGGAALGLAGGPFAEVSVPAGSAGGALIGGAAGWGLGMNACKMGMGSGGGGGSSGGGSGGGSGGAKDIPGRPFTGPNAAQDAFNHLQKYHGLDPAVASERLHQIKEAAGLGAADNAIIGRTGDVYNPHTGEWIGSLTSSH